MKKVENPWFRLNNCDFDFDLNYGDNDFSIIEQHNNGNSTAEDYNTSSKNKTGWE